MDEKTANRIIREKDMGGRESDDDDANRELFFNLAKRLEVLETRQVVADLKADGHLPACFPDAGRFSGAIAAGSPLTQDADSPSDG